MADLGSFLGAAGLGGGAIGAAVVRLQLDSRQYEAELAKQKGVTTASANSMGSAWVKYGAVVKAAGIAAAAGVAALAVSSVKAASDLGEQMNRARQVFGEATDGVVDFARNAADSFGIATSSALDAASGFGAMAQSAGLSEQAAADMSTVLVGLAGDLASFNDQDPSEMLTRLRAGLAGEAEPLRRFGIFISEARVKTEAYTSGIARAGAELTDAQKIQARYNIIMQDSEKAAGDFARTLGESMPNQIRAAKAEFTNLQAEIGQQLLPVITQLLKIVRELMPVLGFAADNLGLIAAAAGGLFVAMKVLPPVLFAVGLGLDKLALSTAANALANVAASLTSLGPAAVAAAEALGVAYLAYKVFTGADPTFVPELSAGLQDIVSKSPEVQQAFADAGMAIIQTGEAADGTAMEFDDLADAIAASNEELRAQADAMLAVVDSAFGVIDALKTDKDAEDELAAATAKVTRMQEAGKTGTKAYRQALEDQEAAALNAAKSQASLVGAVRKLQDDIESGESTMRGAVSDLKAMGREAGLSKDDIRDLIAELKKGISAAGEFGAAGYKGGKAFMDGLNRAIDPYIAYQIAYEVGAKMELGLRAALQAESPSKVAESIGADFILGLVEGLRSQDEKVVRESQRIIDEMIRIIERQLAQTTRVMQKQIDAVEEQLDRLTARADSLRSAVTGGFGSLLDIGGAMGEGVDITAFFQEQLATARQFAAVLQALQAQGASADLLQQIAAAGPEAIPFAQQLLQMGPAGIGEISGIYEQIGALAESTGKALSEAYFGEQIDGLRGDLKEQRKELRDQTRLMERAIRLLERPQRLQVSFVGVSTNALERFILDVVRNSNLARSSV